MPMIFVLAVEEFEALVKNAKARPEMLVSGPNKGYWQIQTKGEMRFERKTLGLKPAVWNGALTGGLLGHIAQFDNDVLRIVEQAP